jgi:hypothetical protein
VELVVDAAVLGSRDLALQALALDPTVDDLDLARAVLDDYLKSHPMHGCNHLEFSVKGEIARDKARQQEKVIQSLGPSRD